MTEPQKAAQTLDELITELWPRIYSGGLVQRELALQELGKRIARDVLEEAAKVAEGYGTGNFERGGRSTANLIAHRLRQMKEGW